MKPAHAIMALALVCAAAQAQSGPAESPVYVPYADLSAVISPADKSVLMDRAEFARLLEAARAGAREKASIEVAQVTDASYSATVEGQKLSLSGALKVVSMSDSPVAMPLKFAQIGLRSLVLDDKPAPLGYNERGELTLIVLVKGEHKLRVEGLAQLKELPAGGLEFGFAMPQAIAASMTLKTPGDISVHSTAPAARSQYDQASDTTTTLLTVGGLGSLTAVLMGNGRQDDQRPILLSETAMSVELGGDSQVLSAACTVQVLRRAVRELRWELDGAWTVTDVTCPDLVKWSIEPGADSAQVLVVRLRQGARGAQALHIRALAPRSGLQWRSPRLRLLEAAYQRGYLMVDTRRDMAVRGETLRDARREDVSAGAAAARLLAASGGRLYHYWGVDWSVQLELAAVELRTACKERQSVWVGPEDLLLRDDLEITAVGRELYSANVLLPPASQGWDIFSVMVQGRQSGFDYRLHDADAPEAPRRLQIDLRSPVPPEGMTTATVVLRRVPPQWQWDQGTPPRDIELPILRAQCDSISGVLGVAPAGDLDVQPLTAPPMLTSVTVGRMSAIGLGSDVQAAWSYEESPQGAIKIRLSRRQPRQAAVAVGLADITAAQVQGDWSVQYVITRASTRTLYLLADKALGRNLRIEIAGEAQEQAAAQAQGAVLIRGDGTDQLRAELAAAVSQAQIAAERIVAPGPDTIELPPALAQRYNLWQITLDQGAIGMLPLRVHYEFPTESKSFDVPLIRPAGVGQTSELLAIQAAQELAVTAQPSGASEIDAIDLPALPAPAGRILAAMRLDSAGTPAGASAAVRVNTVAHQPYAVAPAIARKIELVTYLGADGSQRTAATLELANAGLQFLRFNLPPGAQLWSAQVGSQQAKPGRTPEGDALAVALPRSSQGLKVRIVYAWIDGQKGGSRTLAAPVFHDLQVNATEWRVVSPPGYAIASHDGAMDRADQPHVKPLYARLADHIGTVVDRAISGPTLGEYRMARGVLPLAPFESAKSDTEVNPDLIPLTREVVPSSAPASQPGLNREPVATGILRAGRNTLPVTLSETPQAEESAVFTVLGPPAQTLSVKLVGQWRSGAWWTVGFVLIAIGGLLRINRKPGAKVRLIFWAFTAAVLLSLWWSGADDFAEGVLDGSLAFIPFYIAVGVIRRLVRRFGPEVYEPRSAAAAALLAALLICSGGAQAGATQQPAAPQPVTVASRPAQVASQPVPAAPQPVVIPYDGNPVQADRADKILIGYKQFVELWNAAHPDRPIEMPSPGGRIAISGARFDAVVGPERVELTISATVEALGARGAVLPMPLGNLAVQSAELGGKPIALQAGAGGIVLPLLQGQAGRLEVKALGTPKTQGRRGEIDMALPPLPGAVMKIDLPDDDLVPEVPGADAAPERIAGAKGQWIVPVGLRKDISLRWSPKIPDSAADRTLVANAAHEVYVYHWAVAGVSKLVYTFSGGENDRFWVLLPQGLTLTDVSGANLRDFTIAGTRQLGNETMRVMELRLHRQAAKSYEATLKWLSDLPQADQRWTVALPEAYQVGRESGAVRLNVAGGMTVKTIEAQGGRRVDFSAGSSTAGDVAAPMLQYYWPYRPFKLDVQIARQESVVSANLNQLVRVSPRSVQLLVDAELKAVKGRLFGASFALPEGYELLSAVGEAVADTYVQPSPSGRRLHVNFRAGVVQTRLAMVLVRGDVKLDSLAVPTVTAIGADGRPLDEQSGHLAVQLAASLNAQTASSENLKPVPPDSTRGWLDPSQAAAVQFAYRYETPTVSLVLNVAPKPTRVEFDELAAVVLQQTSAAYAYRLRYTIDGSPVDHVSLSLPRQYGALVAISSPAMRSVSIVTEGDRTRWTVSLVGDLTGVLDVSVNFAIPVDASTTALEVPEIVPEGVDSSHATVLVQNFSAHKLSAGPSPQLRAMQGGRAAPAPDECLKSLQFAYEAFATGWSLSMGVTPAPSAQRIQAVVDLMEIVTVLDGMGQARYSVRLSLQNRSEQFLRLAVSPDLTLWSASVAGEPVKPVVSKSQPGEILIPLVKTSPGGSPYDVQVYLGGRGGQELGAMTRLTPAAVRVVGMEVARTSWSLRLPKGFKYVRPSGNMDPIVGTAETMKLSSDAMIDQLRRLEEYTGGKNSYRGRSLALRSIESVYQRAKTNVEANKKYLKDNSGSMSRDEYGRLTEQTNSQYGVLGAWADKIGKLKEQVDEANEGDITAYANEEATGNGILEAQRDAGLNDIPRFVRQAGQQQREKLQQDIDKATKAPGPAKPAAAPTGEGQAVSPLESRDEKAQAQAVLEKLDSDQRERLAKRQDQLQKELKQLADNRMERYYSYGNFGAGQQRGGEATFSGNAPSESPAGTPRGGIEQTHELMRMHEVAARVGQPTVREQTEGLVKQSIAANAPKVVKKSVQDQAPQVLAAQADKVADYGHASPPDLQQQIASGNVTLNPDGTINLGNAVITAGARAGGATGQQAMADQAYQMAAQQLLRKSGATKLELNGDDNEDVGAMRHVTDAIAMVADGGFVAAGDRTFVGGGTLSLPVELPEGGVQLDFVRNGGDAELSLYAVRASLVDRLYGTGALVIVVLSLLAIWRLIRRAAPAMGRWNWLPLLAVYAIVLVVLDAALGLLGLAVCVFVVVIWEVIRRTVRSARRA